jgi:hypothetical protein
MTNRVPEEALAPLPAGLWQPLMWAYCEGTPIGFVLIVAMPATITAVALFGAAWMLFRSLGAWDPRAYRVFKRARRYRNLKTATLPSRASWRSPTVNFLPRKH